MAWKGTPLFPRSLILLKGLCNVCCTDTLVVPGTLVVPDTLADPAPGAVATKGQKFICK